MITIRCMDCGVIAGTVEEVPIGTSGVLKNVSTPENIPSRCQTCEAAEAALELAALANPVQVSEDAVLVAVQRKGTFIRT